MRHIPDEVVATAVQSEEAQRILREAFLQFGRGEAAVQQRERTDIAGVKLSTLGAVLPQQGIAGAKVYTTIAGKFGFVVILFSAADGRPLATLDAGALTRIRTAACSVLAARAVVQAQPRILGLFGLGVQGLEHAIQMSEAFPFERVLVHDPFMIDKKTEASLTARIGIPVERETPEIIANSADILVTATRSKVPLFPGRLLKEDAFVAAIGSSLPDTRELDDEALRRSKRIIVEWKPQAMGEAGDLVLADPGLRVEDKLVELGDLLAHPAFLTSAAPELSIYKAVGIGLADVALGGLVYQRLAGASEAAS